VSVRRLDQGMAAAAAALLPSERDLSAAERKALRTRYRQLRAMLHTAGLAATYAFVVAKAGADADGEAGPLQAAYEKAASGIRDRLAGLGLLTGDRRRMDAREVLRQFGEMPGADYARSSAEAAALLTWLSRLADACYPPGQDDDAGPGEGR